MKRTTSTLCSLIAVTQAAVAADTSAVSSQTPDLLTKPTWLTEASVTLKEGYDNNVFMSGVGQPYLPAGLETLKDRGILFDHGFAESRRKLRFNARLQFPCSGPFPDLCA